ncbi:MAG TPA: hypothetical protein VFH85_01865 [Gammaproteobacteria bacterium]|nr:hypothetical protein [Gammaproteobacteria bacterium]
MQKHQTTRSLHGTIKRIYRDNAFAVVRRLNNFDPAENFVIFSSPRGGSTWLAELINRLPKTVMLWEPLYDAPSSPLFGARALGFSRNQYIPEDAEWREARDAFDIVLRGQSLNGWSSSMATPSEFLRARRMVVKFCFGPALLPWLTRQFSFRYTPLYLVRHPFAVVASQLRWWTWVFSGFEVPNGRFANHYKQHKAFLSQLHSPEEALVAEWCLTNLAPLRSKRNNRDWITIHYEHLLNRPRDVLQRIFDAWNEPLPAVLLDSLATPSAMTTETSFKNSAARQMTKWKRTFTMEQVGRMMAVLEYFGVEHYGRDTMPKVDSLDTRTSRVAVTE